MAASRTYTHEDSIELIEQLIHNPNPLAAFGIQSPENVTEALIVERAEAIRSKAFEAYGSLGVEGCAQYDYVCQRIEQNRRDAIRMVTGGLPIEEAAANLKHSVTRVGVRSLHYWNPWLNALGFALVAAFAAWASHSLVVGQGVVYAAVATCVNLLIVAIGIYGLVNDRRAMTLFASFAAILPIALVHFSDVLRWLESFRSHLTPTGNALVVPFAGMVGGIFALLVVRTAVTQQQRRVHQVMGDIVASLPQKDNLRRALAWNAQDIKRMLAYAAGGLAAGLSVGFALFTTFQLNHSNIIASLEAEKGKLGSALDAEAAKVSELRQEVSRLESDSSRADRMESELSAARADLDKAKDELENKNAELSRIAQQRDSLKTDLHAEESRRAFLRAATGTSMKFRDESSPYTYTLSLNESGLARVERAGGSGYGDSTFERWSWLEPSSIRIDHPYKSGARLILTKVGSDFKLVERSSEGEFERILFK
jgi:hypothetical protein